jgi:hypothetical protein
LSAWLPLSTYSLQTCFNVLSGTWGKLGQMLVHIIDIARTQSAEAALFDFSLGRLGVILDAVNSLGSTTVVWPYRTKSGRFPVSSCESASDRIGSDRLA